MNRVAERERVAEGAVRFKEDAGTAKGGTWAPNPVTLAPPPPAPPPPAPPAFAAGADEFDGFERVAAGVGHVLKWAS